MTTDGMPERPVAAAAASPSLDELRRRVYSPAATPEDQERYRRALATPGTGASRTRREGVEAAGAPSAPAAEAAAARPGRRPVLLAAAGAVVLLAAVLAAVLPRTISAPPAPAPTPVAVDPDTRAEFLRALSDRGAAGIAAYLVTHRTPVAGVDRSFVIERWGTGPSTISLRPADPTTVSGRATVYLVLDRYDQAAWTLLAPRPTTGSADPLLPMAQRAGLQQGGVPAFGTVRYSTGRRPVQLRLDVPKDVRWGVAVDFSN